MQQAHAGASCSQLCAPAAVRTGVKRRKSSLCRRSTAHSVSVSGTTPEAMQLPRQRLQQLFSSEAPALLLERSIGARAGTDAALWDAVPFAGQILPDLPVANSWPGMLQTASQRCAASLLRH